MDGKKHMDGKVGRVLSILINIEDNQQLQRGGYTFQVLEYVTSLTFLTLDDLPCASTAVALWPLIVATGCHGPLR